jgi:hypothetical protein
MAHPRTNGRRGDEGTFTLRVNSSPGRDVGDAGLAKTFSHELCAAIDKHKKEFQVLTSRYQVVILCCFLVRVTRVALWPCYLNLSSPP